MSASDAAALRVFLLIAGDSAERQSDHVEPMWSIPALWRKFNRAIFV